MTFAVCPKCRLPLDATKQSDACPHWGLIFAKYLAAQRGESPRPDLDLDIADDAPWWSSLLDVPERVSKAQWTTRCILLALIALWGFRIWATDMTQMPPFIHLTLIPFHEAGHVIFWPFGEFLHVAGGTLGQWIIPIICVVALHRQNGDNFGAALATWWLAMCIMDASVYAYDALDPMLPLIGGGTGADSFHDFVYLFGAIGLLKHAQGWGRFMHFVGTLVMMVSLTWAGVVLIRQRRNIDAGGFAEPES
jgi:hypothetical protein